MVLGHIKEEYLAPMVAGQRKISTKDIIMTFETIGELVRQARVEERCYPLSKRVSRKVMSDGWAGTETFEKACDLAVNGWPDGASELWRRADASTRMRKQKPIPERVLDVAGQYPIVPMYCAGMPDHMISQGMDNAVPKPMIKIVWNANIDADLPRETLWNYGAAISACVLGLESKGFRTRLAVLTSVFSSCPFSDYYHHWTKTTIKSPGDIVDMSKIAFAACNPGFMRRIAMATMEQSTCQTYQSHMKNPHTCECVSSLLTADEVYIPSVISESDRYSTFERALRRVQQIFKAKVKTLLPATGQDWSTKAEEALFEAIR